MPTARRTASAQVRMERRWGILMALPAVLGFLLFTLGPMLASFVISLTDWQIGGSRSFIGVQNYRRLLSDDPLFWKSVF
jgi:multiple sugar transport system permease protein